MNARLRKFFRDNSVHPDCHVASQPRVSIRPQLPDQPKRILVIRTGPGSIDYRSFIRQTWKPKVDPYAPVVFVCAKSGTDVIEEAEQYKGKQHNILQFEFADSYHNLSWKMMAIYGFVLSELPSVEEIIVTNDDTIVNITALRTISLMYSSSDPWMLGKVSRGYPRLFMPWLPWHVPGTMYSNLCYPRFTQGSSFILSREGARMLLNNVCKVPFVHLDDVFMGNFSPLGAKMGLLPFLSRSSGKSVYAKVTTMDADLDRIVIEVNWTGRHLFDAVCRIIGLREVWFFGLQYTNKKGIPCWLQMDKEIRKQDVPKGEDGVVQFLFLVKFFPEDVEEELIQDLTRHLFFLQIKQAILSMDLYCSPEASVLLASFAVQAIHGDCLDEVGPLDLEKLLPKSVIDQYDMSADMWRERIKRWWINNQGQSKEDAEMEYLRVSQDLEMYGILYYPICNKKETDLHLGISAQGLGIYKGSNRITPRPFFSWSEIKNISFKSKKFHMKTVDKSTISFQAQDNCINPSILDLCIGTHNLYLRRRQPDTLEVQQMKAQAKEERLRRQQEALRLARERDEREQVETERNQLKLEIEKVAEQLAQANETVRKTEETAELLAEKARASEQETLLLAKRASEAEAECHRLKINHVKSEEALMRMERKAREAELYAQRISMSLADVNTDRKPHYSSHALMSETALLYIRIFLVLACIESSPTEYAISPPVDVIRGHSVVPPSAPQMIHAPPPDPSASQIEYHNIRSELEKSRVYVALRSSASKCLKDYKLLHYYIIFTLLDCINFLSSADEDIDLVPIEEFYSSAPDSIARPDVTREDEHEQRLARLTWEIAQRKQLVSTLNEQEGRRNVLISDINGKEQRLKSLKSKIDGLMAAAKPVQEALGVGNASASSAEQRSLFSLLPHDLSVLYVQAEAYRDIMDDTSMQVVICGSSDEALMLTRRQKDDNEDRDSDDEEGDHERRQRTVSERLEMNKQFITEPHPIYLNIDIGCQVLYLLMRIYLMTFFLVMTDLSVQIPLVLPNYNSLSVFLSINNFVFYYIIILLESDRTEALRGVDVEVPVKMITQLISFKMISEETFLMENHLNSRFHCFRVHTWVKVSADYPNQVPLCSIALTKDGKTYNTQSSHLVKVKNKIFYAFLYYIVIFKLFIHVYLKFQSLEHYVNVFCISSEGVIADSVLTRQMAHLASRCDVIADLDPQLNPSESQPQHLYNRSSRGRDGDIPFHYIPSTNSFSFK
uniref:FERM domain-containing protein n=1 Tax=Heterorhabditis bacteriophora TaxID=37862 RepID=A0A1I7X6C6_HETBA